MPIQVDVLNGFRAGERRALSRAISLAEGDDPAFPALFDALSGAITDAPRIGLTGPPGVGKSTLAAELVVGWRAKGHTVGVLAVDPTSPFTGGALLGDRVRMGAHTLDEGVFIRSMATRGSLGGLARKTVEACDLCAAFGFDRLLIETVGVGQAEHDVMDASDVVVVVLQPGGGDVVQALKAGLVELADVFAINKADQPGVERLVNDLEEAVALRARSEPVPLVPTVATQGKGIDQLVQAVTDCHAALTQAGRLAERRQMRRGAQLRRIVNERLWGARGLQARASDLAATASGDRPYETAERLVSELLGEA
ncbi:MAG: methylmalonyl Co-A mutase-associated GTPase MeaB [Planctomycetes bacterium]|nr:methylmalonyl Co-A mutase-associated GTPase MeaB [Planctomycetota bacterium]